MRVISCHLPMYPSICLSFVCPSKPIYLYACLPACLSICWSMYPSTFLSLSIRLSILLSIDLSVSVYLHLSSLSLSLSIRLSLSLSPSIHLSVYPSICASLCHCVCLSLALSLSLHLCSYVSLMYLCIHLCISLPFYLCIHLSACLYFGAPHPHPHRTDSRFRTRYVISVPLLCFRIWSFGCLCHVYFTVAVSARSMATTAPSRRQVSTNIATWKTHRMQSRLAFLSWSIERPNPVSSHRTSCGCA